ncbi:MAG: cupin domain-containing protein [Gammaproteobacteria bacterium]|jgi:uncharacterized cupin superfamily protein|nr:cupin domain-containing protein [Gammaproteobacteria bacterium]
MQFARKYLFVAVIGLVGFVAGWVVSRADERASGLAVIPTKLTQADLAGAVFTSFASVKTVHEEAGQTWDTTDAEIFLSPDRKFDAGVYESGPLALDIAEPYGVQEFMYFLEGRVILTSLDGSKVEVRAGEAVMISADWRGRWESPEGYRKIYVIYSPDGPLVE